jgi:hypothetical protein
MNARRPKKAMARAIRCGEEDRVIVPAGKSKWLRGINKTYPPHDPEEVVALGTGRSQRQLGVGEAVREALAHHAEDGFAAVVNERPVPRDAQGRCGRCGRTCLSLDVAVKVISNIIFISFYLLLISLKIN